MSLGTCNGGEGPNGIPSEGVGASQSLQLDARRQRCVRGSRPWYRAIAGRQGGTAAEGRAWAKGFRRTSALVREVEHMGNAAAGLSVAVASVPAG
jgi:hypothetical protein